MKTWDELELECRSCRLCPLSETRTNCVFGAGDPNARLMFVGEAPGEKEDLSGIPFVGAAGTLFNQYLTALGIDREHVYISNILKCRPPKNRDPLPAEQDQCIGYLREQVRLVRPEIIVCLGRIAAMRLITPDYKITRDHGVMIRRGDFILTAVYHPAALLRDPRKKEDMYADMKKIKAVLDGKIQVE